MKGPVTRGERQEQTRAALVVAAREVFARDGFHGARLDRIAALAGYSKGAVYSNFDGKAALFLAVMDLNLAVIEPAEGGAHGHHAPPSGGPLTPEEEAQLAEVMSGFGLATLEFIAAAARDGTLRAQLAERIGSTLERYYTPQAAASRADDDPLEPAELGALLAALDQGAALLTLSGTAAMDQRLLQMGMQRLLAGDRSDGAEGGGAGVAGDDVGGTCVSDDRDDGRGVPALHPRDVQRRIADSIRD